MAARRHKPKRYYLFTCDPIDPEPDDPSRNVMRHKWTLRKTAVGLAELALALRWAWDNQYDEATTLVQTRKRLS